MDALPSGHPFIRLIQHAEIRWAYSNPPPTGEIYIYIYREFKKSRYMPCFCLINCTKFSNLSCPILIKTLLLIVQLVADWVVPFCRSQSPLKFIHTLPSPPRSSSLPYVHENKLLSVNETFKSVTTTQWRFTNCPYIPDKIWRQNCTLK